MAKPRFGNFFLFSIIYFIFPILVVDVLEPAEC